VRVTGISSVRASNEGLPIRTLFMEGVAEAALYCAHRTSTVSPCAFCEQEGQHLAAPSHPSEAAHCVSTVNTQWLTTIMVQQQHRHTPARYPRLSYPSPAA